MATVGVLSDLGHSIHARSIDVRFVPETDMHLSL